MVQPKLNTVSSNGTAVRLEPKVMEVLLCLASRPGEPVPKESILSTVWADAFVTDDVLARSISELRRTFGDNPRQPRFIQTIPKRGYRLVAPLGPANGNVPETTLAVQNRKKLKVFPATAVVVLLTFCLVIFRVMHWPARVATTSSFPVQVEAHVQDVPLNGGKDRKSGLLSHLEKTL
ncbi:MAG: winged helix-turn-helix domain-containing protein [Terriglobales bacterium]